MLDRHSEVAIPDESYFIPQLADRHHGTVDVDAFADDLRRLPTLRDWDVPIGEVRARLRPGMRVGEAVAAVYETYAARHGKTRWGDKTPMYMQRLRMLERLFPDALFVHLVRDGRDAALSFLAMPEGIVTETWAHPRTAAQFASQWRMEVDAAQRLGRRVGPRRYQELRYEELVVDPERELRRICEFAELAYEPGMLEYAGEVDVSAKPHQQSLKRPPTAGLRDWRTQLSAGDVAGFEEVAGVLLRRLGYETGRASTVSGALRAASYSARVGAWTAASYALRRSPWWRQRHPPLA
jgi:Sulfotransferase family